MPICWQVSVLRPTSVNRFASTAKCPILLSYDPLSHCLTVPLPHCSNVPLSHCGIMELNLWCIHWFPHLMEVWELARRFDWRMTSYAQYLVGYISVQFPPLWIFEWIKASYNICSTWIMLPVIRTNKKDMFLVPALSFSKIYMWSGWCWECPSWGNMSCVVAPFQCFLSIYCLLDGCMFSLYIRFISFGLVGSLRL